LRVFWFCGEVAIKVFTLGIKDKVFLTPKNVPS